MSSASTDRLARLLAALALGVALVALALALHATTLGQRYLDDVRVIGEQLERVRDSGHSPLNPPPVLLDTD